MTILSFFEDCAKCLVIQMINKFEYNQLKIKYFQFRQLQYWFCMIARQFAWLIKSIGPSWNVYAGRSHYCALQTKIKFLFSETGSKKANQAKTEAADQVLNLEEIEDPQSFIQQQLQQRAKALQLRHSELQTKLDKEIGFPLKLYGTNDQYQSKFAYLPNRIMSYYQIHSTTITDYLLKIYKASVYAMADDNVNFMNQYWDQGLTKEIREVLQKCRTNNYTMKVQQKRDFVNAITDKCEIVDAIMIRGLSTDRKENKHPKQYKKSVQQEQVGLITYTPLNLTQNNQDFIDPIKNKNVYKNYDRMVLRVLVRIKTPLHLNIDKVAIEQDVCTWEHLCVMENEMAPPIQLKSSYKLETFMEWLGKYRFGMWKIVDIDNCMKGNSLFRQQVTQEPLDQIFKGTKLDKSHFIDIRDF